VLLCLIAALAISPADALYRSNAGNRQRTPRTARLDDHEHDHSLEALQTGLDFLASSAGDGGKHELILPAAAIFSGSGGPPGEAVFARLATRPAGVHYSLLLGRSPPAA
jgi:hypothetical protein